MTETGMTALEEAMFDIRNGIVGARFTTRGLREARKLGYARFSEGHGEIKLTASGWEEMHRIEAKYK